MQTSGTKLVQHPLPTPELRGRRNLLLKTLDALGLGFDS